MSDPKPRSTALCASPSLPGRLCSTIRRVRDPFEPDGAWRSAVVGVRALAAAGLALGIGRALLGLVAPSAIPWWAGQRAVVVVLALAALATAATVFRSGLVDGATLILVAVGWAFASLPGAALALGLATAALALLTRRLPAPNRLAILACLASVGLVAVQALMTPPGGAVVVGTAAAILLPVAWFGLFPPRQRWSSTLATLSAMLAGGAAIAALAAEAAVAAWLLAAGLLLYGGFLLAFWVRWTARLVGDIDVDRPPARVFRELTDLRTPLAPDAPERRLEPLDDGPVGVGTRLRYRGSSGQSGDATVTAFEAPAVFEYVIGGMGYRITAWYGIEPRDGGSRVRWRQRLDVPVSWWIRPRYRQSVEAQLAGSAERLRAGRRFADDATTDPSAA